MRNTFVAGLVAALVAFAPGDASAQPTSADPSSVQRAPRKKKDPNAPKPKPLGPARAAARQKNLFMTSVALCERKETCDKDLLISSEKNFVEACEACAPANKCDDERQAIRDGTARKHGTPCDEATAAAAPAETAPAAAKAAPKAKPAKKAEPKK